jgi:hypothetical protein
MNRELSEQIKADISCEECRAQIVSLMCFIGSGDLLPSGTLAESQHLFNVAKCFERKRLGAPQGPCKAN